MSSTRENIDIINYITKRQISFMNAQLINFLKLVFLKIKRESSKLSVRNFSSLIK